MNTQLAVMKTHFLTQPTLTGGRKMRLGAKRRLVEAEPPVRETPDILLVSEDLELSGDLRRIAGQAGRIVLRAGGAEEALESVRASGPKVVLLDLDLPAQAGWKAVDLLFQEAGCPPIILLTADSEGFDVGTAIQTGSLVAKSAGVDAMLEAVDRLRAAPGGAEHRQNAITRFVARLLKPYRWAVPAMTGNRFYGINE